jgi:radical SAM protein with 4Fe4S-binding SPASM domain
MINEAHLTIRANGDVYSCSFYVKKIGNIKTDALSAIVNSFFSDEEYNIIAEHGPQELARRKGIPEEEIKRRFLEHPCKFCHDLLNEN